MAQALTTKRVEAVKPSNKRQEIPDAAHPSLYLVVQPSGAKSWALRYRINGRNKKLTLGKLGAVSLAQARTMAGEALEAIKRGRDPSADKKLENAAKRAGDSTVRSLIVEFDDRYLVRLKTRKSVRQSLDYNVTPILGDMNVKDITRQDVVRLLDGIVDRGKGTTANRVKAYLSTFFGWCHDRGFIDQSPMLGMKPVVKETGRDRFFDIDEAQLFWRACDCEVEPWRTLFKMLLLTGQRRGEVANMRWTDIDDDGTWRLSSTKNGERHDVPLPRAALEMLDAMPRIGEYVFTTNGVKPATSLSKPHARIAARMVELAGHDVPHWTPHALRHTVKSGLAKLKVPLDVRSRLTNHLSDIPPMDRKYNHERYQEEGRESLEKWALTIMETP